MVLFPHPDALIEHEETFLHVHPPVPAPGVEASGAVGFSGPFLPKTPFL
jgi:hypothetical protein